MIETVRTVKCDHCGEVVEVPGPGMSLVYATREAVAGDPRAFLIVAEHGEQHSLLHSCPAAA